MRNALLDILLLAACLAAAAPAGQRVNITVTARGFSPAAVTVGVGDVVVWTNADQRDHAIVADDGSFAGQIKAGQAYSQKFSRPGSYGYSCSLHPREKGRVMVRR